MLRRRKPERSRTRVSTISNGFFYEAHPSDANSTGTVAADPVVLEQAWASGLKMDPHVGGSWHQSPTTSPTTSSADMMSRTTRSRSTTTMIPKIPDRLEEEIPNDMEEGQAVVTIPENGSIVVAGGTSHQFERFTNVVWIWKSAPSTTRKRSGRRMLKRGRDPISRLFFAETPSGDGEWKRGPSLLSARCYFALVLCGRKLYAIGGWNEGSALGTIECIDVSETTEAEWSLLPCRLSTCRSGCAAVEVQNRYIVILGGHDGETSLNTMDILDTQTNTVIPAPKRCFMNTPRSVFGAALVGSKIYAVGGFDGHLRQSSVERINVVLEKNGSENDGILSIFDEAAKWETMGDTCKLTMGRFAFGMTIVGHCLVLAGGCDGSHHLKSVEVVDTEREVVWRLPNLNVTHNGCAAVALQDGNVVVLCGTKPISQIWLMDIQKMLAELYSSRVAVDHAIFTQKELIEQAKRSRDISLVKKGAEAEKVLPHLEKLCDLEQFRSIEDLKQEIKLEENRLQKCQSVADRLPILEKIEPLETQLQAERLAQQKYQQREVVEQSDEAETTCSEWQKRIPFLKREKELSFEEPIKPMPTLDKNSCNSSELKHQNQKVFLSHTGQDPTAAVFAGILADHLQDKHDIASFLDSNNLEPGDAWQQVIGDNARNCRLFVCIVSPSYFMRYWCLHELDLALGAGCPILPVFLDGEVPKANESFRGDLYKLLQHKNKNGDVDLNVLERWCENLQTLESIQGIRNYSSHKHSLVEFRGCVANVIKEKLKGQSSAI